MPTTKNKKKTPRKTRKINRKHVITIIYTYRYFFLNIYTRKHVKQFLRIVEIRRVMFGIPFIYSLEISCQTKNVPVVELRDP